MKMQVYNERYFSQDTFEKDVFEFSKMPLSYWQEIREMWHATHKHSFDDLIDGSKEYTHEELIALCNHEVFNAYGYAELAHKFYSINDHLNSQDRPWMRFIYNEYMPGKKIFDHGCWDLTNTMCFYDMGYKVTAADMLIDWIKFIEYRCKKYNVDIDFRYTDNNYTFLKDDDIFDIIFSHEVLEHVKDPDKVLECLLQHLKVGGLIFLTVTFTEGAFHLKDNHARFGYGPEGNVHYHPEWMKVLDNLNLKPIGNDFYIKEK